MHVVRDHGYLCSIILTYYLTLSYLEGDISAWNVSKVWLCELGLDIKGIAYQQRL